MSRKSILQDEKKCFFCGTTQGLERHHVVFGSAGRKISDKLGLTIWLCSEHHRGDYSPHQRRDIDLRLRRLHRAVTKINIHMKSGWKE